MWLTSGFAYLVFMCCLITTKCTTVIEEYTEEIFQSMSVKQLTNFISERGEVCKHCTDKPEYVQLAYSLKHVSVIMDDDNENVEDGKEKVNALPDASEYTEDSFKALSIKDLNNFIVERGGDCKFCTDKSEYINLAYSLKNTPVLEKAKVDKQKKEPPSTTSKSSKKEPSADKTSKAKSEKSRSEKTSKSQKTEKDASRTAKKEDETSKESKAKKSNPEKKKDKATERAERKERMEKREKERAAKEAEDPKKKSSPKSDSKAKAKPPPKTDGGFDMDNMEEFMRNSGMNGNIFTADDLDKMSTEELKAKFSTGSGSYNGYKAPPTRKKKQKRDVKPIDPNLDPSRGRTTSQFEESDVIEL